MGKLDIFTSGNETIQERAERETNLIVSLYCRGLVFEQIAELLGRDHLYLSNVLKSPLGQQEIAKINAKWKKLSQDTKHRVEVEAQRALDNILALATAGKRTKGQT